MLPTWDVPFVSKWDGLVNNLLKTLTTIEHDAQWEEYEF